MEKSEHISDLVKSDSDETVPPRHRLRLNTSYPELQLNNFSNSPRLSYKGHEQCKETNGSSVVHPVSSETALKQSDISEQPVTSPSTTIRLAHNVEDMPLSPDSVDSSEDCKESYESMLRTTVISDTSISEDHSSSMDDSSLSVSSKNTAQSSDSEPPEVLCESEVTSTVEESQANPSESPTLEQHREIQEEWSSQQLWEVSHNIRVRSQQVKRLIMSSIRKRQMADESLESFKKRLRRL